MPCHFLCQGVILFYWLPIPSHLDGQLPFFMVMLGHKCRLPPVVPLVGSHPMSTYHLETRLAIVGLQQSRQLPTVGSCRLATAHATTIWHYGMATSATSL